MEYFIISDSTGLIPRRKSTEKCGNKISVALDHPKNHGPLGNRTWQWEMADKWRPQKEKDYEWWTFRCHIWSRVLGPVWEDPPCFHRWFAQFIWFTAFPWLRRHGPSGLFCQGVECVELTALILKDIKGWCPSSTCRYVAWISSILTEASSKLTLAKENPQLISINHAGLHLVW